VDACSLATTEGDSKDKLEARTQPKSRPSLFT
jgi:hypothetical protein